MHKFQVCVRLTTREVGSIGIEVLHDWGERNDRLVVKVLAVSIAECVEVRRKIVALLLGGAVDARLSP